MVEHAFLIHRKKTGRKKKKKKKRRKRKRKRKSVVLPIEDKDKSFVLCRENHASHVSPLCLE